MKPKAMPPTRATGGETMPLPAMRRPRRKTVRLSNFLWGPDCAGGGAGGWAGLAGGGGGAVGLVFLRWAGRR
jgi:hypothetical protein